MYSTVSPLGIRAIRCTWISGTRWLTPGRLKPPPSRHLHPLGDTAHPQEVVITISMSAPPEGGANGTMPSAYSPAAIGVVRASAMRASPG